MRLLLLIPIFFCLAGLSARASYNSKILKTKDYEEMREILNSYIKSSQDSLSKTGEEGGSGVFDLKQGLKILLMRPDTDSVKSALILTLRNEIIKYRSFMAVFGEVVGEAIHGFQSQKGSLADQASLLYLIENSIAYLQSIKNKDSQVILTNIKEAKLSISKKLSKYLLLEMGRGKTASPSYLAKKVLKDRLEQAKKAQAMKEKAKKTAGDLNKRKPSSSIKAKELEKKAPLIKEAIIAFPIQANEPEKKAGSIKAKGAEKKPLKPPATAP